MPDFDAARVVPSAGPSFHGPTEQYEDMEGGGSGAPSTDLFAATPDAPRLGRLRIVPDEANPQNHVLRFRLAEPKVVVQWLSGPQRKSRVQAELYGNFEPRDFYQSVRLRLPAPQNTVVEGSFTDGKLTALTVTPATRRKDIVSILGVPQKLP